MPGGTETVLFVEDEPAVRGLGVMVLRRLGYNVLEAAGGDEALSIVRKTTDVTIDLLLTDVVMPKMSGKQLADRLQASHPHIKVLFASGYTEDAIVSQGVLTPGIEFSSQTIHALHTCPAHSRSARSAGGSRHCGSLVKLMRASLGLKDDGIKTIISRRHISLLDRVFHALPLARRLRENRVTQGFFNPLPPWR